LQVTLHYIVKYVQEFLIKNTVVKPHTAMQLATNICGAR